MATLQRPMGLPYMPQTFRSPKKAGAVASSFFFDARLPEPYPAGKIVAAPEDLRYISGCGRARKVRHGAPAHSYSPGPVSH